MATDSPQGPFRRVLVPVNGSSDSRAALQMAVALARVSGGVLTLMTVAAAPAPVEGWDPSADMTGSMLAAADTEELVERLCRDTLEEAAALVPGDLPSRTVLSAGPAGPAIVEEARRGHDVLVIASRHRRELGRLLHGHVGQHILHHAPIPVVVVPTGHPAGTGSDVPDG